MNKLYKKRRKNWKLRTLLAASILLTSASADAQYLDGNTRAWGDIDYEDDPWVFNVSRPNIITEGLQDRHISLWASHGRYYDNDSKKWKWQRPNIFGTTEDLFTQTIVIPYLIPMLQNAGAIVFTPRERDWQTHEVIVDNDDAIKRPYYLEFNNSKNWKDCDSLGFAWKKQIYSDGDNPFKDGTVRQIKATKKQKNLSEVWYQPNIPKAGKYAVYVSYQTVPKSVKDAKYIVYHKGVATEFSVNQTMGGGTWVYLGTFDFDQGCNASNRVVVTNHASKKGIITTDAVRFGGGMGNIQRGGWNSGLPRCLEGARYYAQWAGMPYYVYSGRNGINDYADDINVRSFMTNYLAGRSVYQPAREGLNVPIELSLAIHSDAGYEKDGHTTTGTLTICTTNFNEGLYNSGISRMTSKDLANALLNNTVLDIRDKYHNWNKRYLWDKNYSETRVPDVPSAIIETLSHQNFADMKLAQDPMFRFTMARSIYKTLLRYITTNHGKSYIVEPLQPENFSIHMDSKGNATLSWTPQMDNKEKTARPTSYNVYTATGAGGFDNGININRTSVTFKLLPNVQYNFKVTACNAGGESFPSEVLSAVYNPKATKTVLIVNNFHRLAAPQVIDNTIEQGFDLDADPGVSYGKTAGWNGRQRDFDITYMGKEGPGGLGYGGDELAGKFIAGNDFDYPVAHTEAIMSAGKYNVVSCSSDAVLTGKVVMNNYPIVDLIEGLERYDGYTPEFYKSFTPKMQNLISAYTRGGGSILVSGSYIGSDMTMDSEKDFLSQTLKTQYAPNDSVQINGTVNGLGMNFDFYNYINEDHYAAVHPNIIQPTGNAICAMQYGDGSSAATAYNGRDYKTFVMGFPFECIKDRKARMQIMRGILNYLDK